MMEGNTLDTFDAENELPFVFRVSQIGVADGGSGVNVLGGGIRTDDDLGIFDGGLDDIVVENSCGNGEAVEEPAQSVVNYISPMKTIETTHTIVASNSVTVVTRIEPPQVGMVFKTWQDVESYYKDYAEQQGFGVSRVQGVNHKLDKTKRIATTWKCECWGVPDMRARREAKKRAKAMDVAGTGGVIDGVVGEDELRRGKRTSKKCECTAMLYASVNDDGEWVVRSVELQHANHKPSPSKSNLVKEYRMKHFTKSIRKKLLNFFEEGVPIRQIHGCMATERNGMENMSLTVKDLQHEVYKARRLKMVGGDAVAMMDYFAKMQAGNQNFFHAQRLDVEGRLKDVLWVDARSQAAYIDFGDVVCFDATYLTNEYDLPFVNFVGVNHHGQSILLGCALVSHEDSDTFTWIFRQWLAAMNDRPPKAILTDQAAAMRKPLAEVMPSTRHRWCIWHIMRKFPEKLGKCSKYSEFKNKLKEVIYESFTPDEFENRWCTLMTTYKLESNDWLQGLYKERHMWIPAYMKEYFWAGMKTTQRVESINSFFDGFLTRNTKLFEFPDKYRRAMDRRIRDETDADARCSKYIRRLISGFKAERIFQKLYTDTKFQEVQTECSRMMYVYDRGEHMIADNVIKYILEDRVWIVPNGRSEEIITDRRRLYSITFNTETKAVCCDCRRFETHGILCKHMIRILDRNLVFDIPEMYIVSRWRKDIMRKHTRIRVADVDPEESATVKRFNILMDACEPLLDEAAMVNDETVELVLNGIKSLRSEVNTRRLQKLEQTIALSFPEDANGSNSGAVTTSLVKKPSLLVSSVPNDVYEVCVKDPPPKKKGRGRPKGSRNKSLAEIGFKKPKQKQVEEAEVNVDLREEPHCASLIIPAKRKHVCDLDGLSEEARSIVAEECLDFVEEDDLLVRNSIGYCSGPPES